MLRIDNVSIRRDGFLAIDGVSLEIEEGETVFLLGPNGAGKSTLMGGISGLHPLKGGCITMGETRLDSIAVHLRPAMGLIHVMERRHLFPSLTVLENLRFGNRAARARGVELPSVDQVMDIFPALGSSLQKRAGELSGGEQQMVAIGRGLMAAPRILMIDEPFLGISPHIAETIFDVIMRLRRQRLTMVVVDQDVDRSLELAERCVFLVGGRVALTGSSNQLRNNDQIRLVYGLTPTTKMHQ